MKKISLQHELTQIHEHWMPRVVAELNGQHVRMAKIKGEFDWHHHDNEDELFLVLNGRMRLEFRDHVVELEQGEMAVVPKGVEHRPVAADECHIMLFEPASTINTGNVVNEQTITQYSLNNDTSPE
ncbi:MAG: cupin domain-containing protein [Phycisphaerae bacterium]